MLSYASSTVLAFNIDGSTEPAPFSVSFVNAGLELSLTLSNATSNFSITTAQISGTFRVFNRDINGGVGAAATILEAVAPSGAFVSIGAAGTVNTDFDFFGLVLTAGAQLQNLLQPGRFIAPPFDSVFTVTDIAPLPLSVVNGTISDFAANASFSGTANVVPTPGSVALLALGGFAASRRRR
ncbi:MAG: hypothetical protein C0468_00305 [Planctomyces sp.]|nr:hypothetical protein [Planctomyces sp.]